MTKFDDCLTPDQLSQQLGVSTRTLARWHALRYGPPRAKIGKLILYRLDAVRAWIQANESHPVAMVGGGHG